MKKPDRKADLSFFPDFWVPYWNGAQAKYKRADKLRYTSEGDSINSKSALEVYNKAINNISQRSSVVTSSISIVFAASLVFWINFAHRYDGLAKYLVLIGIFCLLTALFTVMSTMYLHWGEYIEYYENDEMEFERTRSLSWSRAFRVNAAIFLSMTGLILLFGGAIWDFLSVK